MHKLIFYDKWTIIQKTFSPVPFVGNFWNFYFKKFTCNRLKHVFEQIISLAAIENIYFEIKINNNMKLYFIWEDLVHFNTVSLN